MSEVGMQYKGDLVLSLMYVTPDKVETKKSKSRKSKNGAAEQMGQIQAMIKAAKNLTAVRSNGTSDPFVKGSVFLQLLSLFTYNETSLPSGCRIHLSRG